MDYYFFYIYCNSYGKILWKHSDFEFFELPFKGNINLSSEITNLSTPLAFFKYFFTDDFLQIIVDESNIYSCEKNPDNTFTLSSNLLQKYLGILIMTSAVYVPDIRKYWAPVVGNSTIMETMTINEFEKIRSVLHFNSNTTMVPRTDAKHDRLHKIRPILDHLTSKFSSIPLEECLSLDEQICGTKIKSYLKQYMPAKPHKWGFKFFVLSGVSGYTYNFEIYTGKDEKENIFDNEIHLGASANVVTRLTRVVTQNVNHKIFFDRFYTTVPLVVELAKNGIYSLGTIQRNRVPNCKLPTESELKKKERGFSSEFFATVENTDVCLLTWKDNKPVNLLSTFVSCKPMNTCNRFDKAQKKNITLQCPNAIKQYNKHMGGVDLVDSFIGRYRIKMKSKKWYMRIFYHLLDVTIINSWLLYKRVLENKKEKPVNLYDFRVELAETLCKKGLSMTKTKGRPSGSSPNISKVLEARKRKFPRSHVPPKDIRLDETSHWATYMTSRLRCKLPNCDGFTFIKCEKCDVSLCLNKNKNCFKRFHNI